MKRTLLLIMCALMISSVAMADHVGIYSDASGQSCTLALGFNPNVTVIEKFSTGTTGCRFRVDFGGNNNFGFNTPWVPVGAVASDLSLAYGSCQTGSVVLGTLTMNNTIPGSLLRVLPAGLFSNIIYTNCSFAELPATGGKARVGSGGEVYCEDPFATQPSTWGGVKALYR
jgi:hypothetical protein